MYNKKFLNQEKKFLLQIFSVSLCTKLTLNINRYDLFCCDWKSPSGMCAKLHTVAASNNRDHVP